MMNILRKISTRNLVLMAIVFSFIAQMIVGYVVKDSFFERGNSYGPLNALAFNLIDNTQYSMEKGIPSVDYEPLYPFIMALCYKIFGKSWFGLTVLHGILFGLTSWLLFLIGIIIKDELAGAVAAIYHSIYPYLWFHAISIFDTTQFIFIIALLLWLTIRKPDPDQLARHYFLIGIAMGLSLLSRGSAMAILPPFCLYILVKADGFGFMKKIIVISIAAVIVLSPWLFRNYNLTGKPIISVHGSYGFWQGNNEKSYEYLNKNITLDAVTNDDLAIYKQNPIKARPPKEAVRVAQLYKDEALKYISNNPEMFLKLLEIKFIKFWSWTYNPVKQSYPYGSPDLRQLVYFVSYLPLLMFLPFGLYFFYEISRFNCLLFIGVILTYTAAHMLVMGFTRARLPLDIFLMLLFGVAVSSLQQRKILENVWHKIINVSAFSAIK